MVVDHEIPRRDEKKTYSSFIFGSENNFPFEIFMMVFMKKRLNANPISYNVIFI